VEAQTREEKKDQLAVCHYQNANRIHLIPIIPGDILWQRQAGGPTMSMERPDPPLKLYMVTMKMEATYSLAIPAISEVEAILLADEKPIPMAELVDVVKDVEDVAEMELM
jgi:hypothetical protein